MITYCYTDPISKKTSDWIFPRGEAPESIVIPEVEGNIVLERNRRAELSGITFSVKTKDSYKPASGPWPMKPCVGSGVNANQAQELRDHFQRNGVSVEVTNDGDPIYTSAEHRKRALKCRGIHDNNSFS